MQQLFLKISPIIEFGIQKIGKISILREMMNFLLFGGEGI